MSRKLDDSRTMSGPQKAAALMLALGDDQPIRRQGHQGFTQCRETRAEGGAKRFELERLTRRQTARPDYLAHAMGYIGGDGLSELFAESDDLAAHLAASTFELWLPNRRAKAPWPGLTRRRSPARALHATSACEIYHGFSKNK